MNRDTYVPPSRRAAGVEARFVEPPPPPAAAIDVANAAERDWFDAALVDEPELRDRCSINALLRHLVGLFDVYIERQWAPAEIARIRGEAARASADILELGVKPQDIDLQALLHDIFVDVTLACDEPCARDILDICKGVLAKTSAEVRGQEPAADDDAPLPQPAFGAPPPPPSSTPP